jgi:tetratricopeptide (TPR) repeat protein
MKMQTKPTGKSKKASKPPTPLFGLSKHEIDAIEVLGFELYQQGRTHEAQAIFEGLIAVNDQRYQGYAGKGAMALAEGMLEEAAGWLNQALDRNAADPTVHANLGETLLRLGRFDEAAAEFEKVMALDPEQKDPGANRARAILAGMQAMIEGLKKSGSSEQQSKTDSDK